MSAHCVAWRIAADTPDYEAHDLTGKGAETTGGRWNAKGTPMIYSSESRSLACLETLVHLSGPAPLPLNRYLVEIRIPLALWKARQVFDGAKHVGWDAEPAGRISIGWGTTWATSKKTLLAAVPSIVVADEHNILINPCHPDVTKLTAKKIKKWTYDLRLKK